jgi:hypothetical protein
VRDIYQQAIDQPASAARESSSAAHT